MIWFSKASDIIFFTKKSFSLKSIKDMPIDMWNQSPTPPWARIPLLACWYSCWIVSISLWLILYFFIVAHGASCHTQLNAIFKSMITWKISFFCILHGKYPLLYIMGKISFFVYVTALDTLLPFLYIGIINLILHSYSSALLPNCIIVGACLYWF